MHKQSNIVNRSKIQSKLLLKCLIVGVNRIMPYYQSIKENNNNHNSSKNNSISGSNTINSIEQSLNLYH